MDLQQLLDSANKALSANSEWISAAEEAAKRHQAMFDKLGVHQKMLDEIARQQAVPPWVDEILKDTMRQRSKVEDAVRELDRAHAAAQRMLEVEPPRLVPPAFTAWPSVPAQSRRLHEQPRKERRRRAGFAPFEDDIK